MSKKAHITATESGLLIDYTCKTPNHTDVDIYNTEKYLITVTAKEIIYKSICDIPRAVPAETLTFNGVLWNQRNIYVSDIDTDKYDISGCKIELEENKNWYGKVTSVKEYIHTYYIPLKKQKKVIYKSNNYTIKQ
jgi:hypothetical protein